MNSPKQSDDLLATAVKRFALSDSDKQAWATIYGELYPLLLAESYRILRGQQVLAEEATQQALVEVKRLRFADFVDRFDEFIAKTIEICRTTSQAYLMKTNYPSPDCLLPDEVVAYISDGGLQGKRLEHLANCKACTALVASALPVRSLIDPSAFDGALSTGQRPVSQTPKFTPEDKNLQAPRESTMEQRHRVPQSNRMLNVFLCHSSQDKPAVRELYRRLKDEGFDPWLDDEKLMPGQDWNEEITLAVRSADVVIVCLSNSSITKDGYVQREIRVALDRAEEKPPGSIFIIPGRLEELEVPRRLKQWQWVNLFQESGYTKLIGVLRKRSYELDSVR
jgi:hypothetical protein